MKFNESIHTMEGVGDLQKNFNSCICSMRFTRRCLAKCMLTQKFYEGDYEPKMIDSIINFWDQMYESIDGGHFRTHNENKHLIELFKVYHTMIELNALTFYTTYDDSLPFPSVKVERSNGDIHSAFLDTMNTLRVSDNKIYIRLQFIDNPNELIEKIVTEKFKFGDFKFQNDNYPIGMFKNGFKLMESSVDDIRKQYMKKTEGVQESELQDMMLDFTIKIDEINKRINYYTRTKLVQLCSFIKINPDFDHKLEIRHLYCSNKEDIEACKMAELLNKNMDHQLQYLHTYTEKTASYKFYELIQIVN